MVEVDSTTLEKWTLINSNGILLLSLYRFKLLMDKKKLDIRMVYPGAKILALIISQEVRLKGEESEYYQQVLKHISSKLQLIPIDEIRKSAELLLSACAGNINIPLSRDKSLVDSFSLFNILASMAIRKGIWTYWQNCVTV
uniref:Uncharacterized protein n=1 Tax=Ditylenchus dipsaci TaxID=166011 RepID=A0A915DTC9_9BILA